MQGEVRKLKQVFNSFMEIPIYQRNYDWKIAQCERLFNDLIYAGENDLDSHFFGSIVRKVGSDEVSQIIDGQQRITTVSLLVSAMANAAIHGEIESNSDKQINQVRHQFLFDEDEETHRKIYLKPVKKDTEAFDAIVYDKPIPDTSRASNVARNYKYLYDRVVASKRSLGDLVELVKKLEVMDLKLSQQDDAQLIFESLNSTGLALTESDKIRNYILMNMKADAQQRCYEDYWLKIEQCTHFEDEEKAKIATTTAFIRDYITIKAGRICKESHIYEEFKRLCERDNISREERLAEMLTYAEANYAILKAKTDDKQTERKFKELATLSTRLHMTFLIPFFVCAKSKGWDAKTVTDVVDIVESYFARRTACGMPTNALNKIFCSLHNDTMRKLSERGDATGEAYVDTLKFVLLSKQGSSAFPNDTEVRAKLETREIYRLPSESRTFIFDRLENGNDKEYIDIAQNIKNGSTSIEHIMPQSLDDNWKKALGDNWDDIHNKYLHTLANLTLTGWNSEYSNRSFIEKRDGFEAQGGANILGFSASHLRLSETLRNLNQWTEVEILDRQKWMADRFLSIFPQISSSLTRNITTVVSLADGGDVLTGKKLMGYRLFDEDNVCDSWRDMLVSVCTSLYEKYPDEILQECARGNRLMHDNSNTIRPVKIDDNCYVDTNNSTVDKIKGLQALFNICDIEPDELELYVKPETDEQR